MEDGEEFADKICRCAFPCDSARESSEGDQKAACLSDCAPLLMACLSEKGDEMNTFMHANPQFQVVSALSGLGKNRLSHPDISTTQHKTVAELAREMKTSRAAVNRILDEKKYSLSLKTLFRAASALGKRLRLELVEVLAAAAFKMEFCDPRAMRG